MNCRNLICILALVSSSDVAANPLHNLGSDVTITTGGLSIRQNDTVLSSTTGGLDLGASYQLSERTQVILRTNIAAGRARGEVRGEKMKLGSSTALATWGVRAGLQQFIRGTNWQWRGTVGTAVLAYSSSTTFSYSDLGGQVALGITREFSLSKHVAVGASLDVSLTKASDSVGAWHGQSIDLGLALGVW